MLKETSQNKRLHGNYTPLWAIDTSNQRLLSYDQLLRYSAEHTVEFPPDLLSDYQQLDIRNDLLDTGVEICSPDVLALWQDSFDLQAPRRQFLKLTLRDYELNNKTIYTYITNSGYSARVRDLKSYASVAKDIIAKRSYPLSPEFNMISSQNYSFSRGNVYKDEDVVLHRQASVEKDSVIGQGTSIGAESVITRSTIGRGCIVGRGVRISDSHIFDDTVIGDYSTVISSIVANEVVIGKRCLLDSSILSWSCRISDGVPLTNKRITLPSGDTGAAGDPGYFSIVGDKGKGIEYEPGEDELADADLGEFSNNKMLARLA